MSDSTIDESESIWPLVDLNDLNAFARCFRWTELILVFGFGPLAFWQFLNKSGLLFPLLWLWMFACLGVMFATKRFAWRKLGWRKGEIRSVFKSFAVLGGGLALAVVAWDLVDSYRDILFRLIRRNPGLWAAIMVGYPIASVYPQEVIFRAFFFDRFRPLFKEPWKIVAASALAFAWVHIIFGNPIAVALTLPGGVIFAYRYLKTESTLVVSVEHALYGCLVFTIGIGGYFYSGPEMHQDPDSSDQAAVGYNSIEFEAPLQPPSDSDTMPA